LICLFWLAFAVSAFAMGITIYKKRLDLKNWSISSIVLCLIPLPLFGKSHKYCKIIWIQKSGPKPTNQKKYFPLLFGCSYSLGLTIIFLRFCSSLPRYDCSN
jgi:hypothetical protein